MTEWLLVDGSSLIFRAFFGVPRTIRAPDGRPVNAVRGFLDYLAHFIATREPRRVLVAGDDDWRPQWRVDLLPRYKTHPTELAPPPHPDAQMTAVAPVPAALRNPLTG